MEDVLIFKNDDAGYLAWMGAHRKDGYVINTRRPPSRKYLKLHYAACYTISGTPARGDVWTQGQYAKVCSTRRDSLETWAWKTFRKKVDPCEICFA